MDTPRMRILYLDGTHSEQVSLHELIRAESGACQFTLAATLSEFATCLRTGQVDLVLSDCAPPELDGLQVLDMVGRSHPLLPVILLDANASITSAVCAMQHGAADYLPKTPQGLSRLADAISAALCRCRHLQAQNATADALQSKAQHLEHRNRSLQMLYRITGALASAPLSRQLLENALTDIRQVITFASASICSAEDSTMHGDVLACVAADSDEAASDAPEMLVIPLRDQAQLLGVLKIALAPGRHIEPWEQQLLETVAFHFSTALFAVQRQEEIRRITALEERAGIARELHDSLAQSLWYARIQMARLAKASEAATSLAPEQRARLDAVITELHSGLNDAHRQLRQLISSFRAGDGEHGLTTVTTKPE